jgi:hypothetical protein
MYPPDYIFWRLNDAGQEGDMSGREPAHQGFNLE